MYFTHNGELASVASYWYTNMDTAKRHRPMLLGLRYGIDMDYKKYDNYDAIEVSKLSEIPCDYYGVMGVPITIMDKLCPEQFEIIGATESEGKGFSNGLWDESSKIAQAVVNGQRVFKRIFIKRVGV
jgi:hypothetical protein